MGDANAMPLVLFCVLWGCAPHNSLYDNVINNQNVIIYTKQHKYIDVV